MNPTPDAEITVDAFVRPTQLTEPIDAKIRTLRKLEEEGQITAMTVHAWPGEITLNEETPHTEAVEAFKQFEAWADRHDVSIRPPFTAQMRSSNITGEERTVIVTPVMSVAVSVDDQLANVFPHRDGDRQYGVGDAIEALTTGETDLLTANRGAPAPTRPEACPECGDGDLVTIQGVGACRTCHWAGIDVEPVASDDQTTSEPPRELPAQK